MPFAVRPRPLALDLSTRVLGLEEQSVALEGEPLGVVRQRDRIGADAHDRQARQVHIFIENAPGQHPDDGHDGHRKQDERDAGPEPVLLCPREVGAPAQEERTTVAVGGPADGRLTPPAPAALSLGAPAGAALPLG